MVLCKHTELLSGLIDTVACKRFNAIQKPSVRDQRESFEGCISDSDRSCPRLSQVFVLSLLMYFSATHSLFPPKPTYDLYFEKQFSFQSGSIKFVKLHRRSKHIWIQCDSAEFILWENQNFPCHPQFNQLNLSCNNRLDFQTRIQYYQMFLSPNSNKDI